MSTPADQLTPPGAPPGAPPGGPAPGAPAGPGAPPMAPPMGAGGPPTPGAAPAMAPQAARGDQASADSKMQVALRIMEDALVAHRSSSPKGRAILKAIQALTKEFAAEEDGAQKVLPAELKSALMDQAPGTAPPPGGGAPTGPGALPPGGPPGGPGMG